MQALLVVSSMRAMLPPKVKRSTYVLRMVTTSNERYDILSSAILIATSIESGNVAC